MERHIKRHIQRKINREIYKEGHIKKRDIWKIKYGEKYKEIQKRDIHRKTYTKENAQKKIW